MQTYRISQLAERCGVPATTLRYYESSGLLPAARTASGYRVYDESSAQRLEFISAAKLLGLALEEIRDLLRTWEAGVCAHVREQMLPLVAQRIEDADRRRAELEAFAARLTQVHAQLSTTPAPMGSCGPGCGCVPDPEPVLVELTTPPGQGPAQDETARGDEREPWREAPVACTLTGTEMVERTGRWQALLDRATGREEIPGGTRITFPAGPELAGEVASLAAAEQDCCGFLGFSLTLAPDQLVLTVRAPEAARGMLADLLGTTA